MQTAGLTLRSASAFLGTAHANVESWSQDRRPVPATAIAALLALYRSQMHDAARSAAFLRRQMKTTGWPDWIELGAAADDHEAQLLGWPTAACHHVVLAMTIARLNPPETTTVRIVPRGSTMATAAAADQLDQALGPKP